MKAVIEEGDAKDLIEFLENLQMADGNKWADFFKEKISEHGKLSGYYQQAAQDHHMVSDGELEVDENATVSHGADAGAYVNAWLWVCASDMREVWRAAALRERIDRGVRRHRRKAA